MRIHSRRYLLILPVLLLAVLAWQFYHLLISWSCSQARGARSARRSVITDKLRSLTDRKDSLAVELEMLTRSDQIEAVCKKYQLGGDNSQDCGYRSRDSSFDQNIIQNNFLADPRTGSVYCFVHKVASSTWMSLFARLENNTHFLNQMEEDGNYYQIKYRLSPSLLDLLWSDSLSFLVVRHPLDRLISAYRDRILDPRTDQARQHIPAMLHNSGGQGKQPSFAQFLQYVADGGSDVHWASYYSTCAPCLIGFDWIIKLEDQNIDKMSTALLDKSGMGRFVRLESKHRANSSSSQYRHLYREVDCKVIRRVVEFFKMDMLLFQYSAENYLTSLGVFC